MDRYLYVEARNVAAPDEGVLVSFDAVSVLAVSDEDAYNSGPSALAEQRAATGDDSHHFADATGREHPFLNDYVHLIAGDEQA